jgi:hypothetical protein
VGAFLAPAHLLFFDHSFAHNLIYGRFGKSGGDGLPISVALGVTWDEGCVVADIGLELFQLLDQSVVLLSRIFSIDIIRLAAYPVEADLPNPIRSRQ